MSADPTILVRGPLKALQSAQTLLGRSGIDADVVRPPDCDPNA